jgi:hypothetical protein
MDKRITQCDKILRLLQSKQEVGLPEILGFGIAQYNARIKELREAGHDIRNRTKLVDGVKHSWYRLVDKTEQEREMAQRNLAQEEVINIKAVERPAFMDRSGQFAFCK